MEKRAVIDPEWTPLPERTTEDKADPDLDDHFLKEAAERVQKRTQKKRPPTERTEVR